MMEQFSSPFDLAVEPSNIKLPTNAQVGYVMTCADSNGSAEWQPASGSDITIVGTANHVNVSRVDDTVTITTPQATAAGSNVSYGTLTLTGALNRTNRVVTGSATLGATDDVIQVNVSSSNSATVLTLPANPTVGKTYTVLDIAGTSENIPIGFGTTDGSLLSTPALSMREHSSFSLTLANFGNATTVSRNGNYLYYASDVSQISVYSGLMGEAPTFLKNIDVSSVGNTIAKLAMSQDGTKLYAAIRNSPGGIAMINDADTGGSTVSTVNTTGDHVGVGSTRNDQYLLAFKAGSTIVITVYSNALSPTPARVVNYTPGGLAINRISNVFFPRTGNFVYWQSIYGNITSTTQTTCRIMGLNLDDWTTINTTLPSTIRGAQTQENLMISDDDNMITHDNTTAEGETVTWKLQGFSTGVITSTAVAENPLYPRYMVRAYPGSVVVDTGMNCACYCSSYSWPDNSNFAQMGIFSYHSDGYNINMEPLCRTFITADTSTFVNAINPNAQGTYIHRAGAGRFVAIYAQQGAASVHSLPLPNIGINSNYRSCQITYANSGRWVVTPIDYASTTLYSNRLLSSSINVISDFAPRDDNTITSGRAARRWTAVYAVNGTIQTSDINLKKDIVPLGNCLEIISSLNPVKYKWNDSTDEKKDHYGLIAQDVEAALPNSYVVSLDSPKGIVYTELIAPLIGAIKELTARNADLTRRIEVLEKTT